MNSFDAYPLVRACVRALLAAVLAFFGALATALVDNSVAPVEWATIGLATFGVLGSFLGVGTITPIEPFVGPERFKRAHVKVPMPPARPTKPKK